MYRLVSESLALAPPLGLESMRNEITEAFDSRGGGRVRTPQRPTEPILRTIIEGHSQSSGLSLKELVLDQVVCKEAGVKS